MAEETISLPDGAFSEFPVPPAHATNIQIAPINQTFSLVFTGPRMGTAKIKEEGATIAQMVPVASLLLSPQALKDLSLLVAKAVSDYEAEWGNVETLYTRKTAEAAKEAAKA